MRIPLAFFADSAIAHPDGKLYVMGGGLHTLEFSSFPAIQARLALAVGVEVSRAETGVGHTMTIKATGQPRHGPIVKPVTVSFTVSPDELDPSELHHLHVVAEMDNVWFPDEGTYSFAISVDGVHLESVDLSARRRRRGDVPLAEQSMQRLQEGYEAFGRGDVSLAEEIFRDVVTRFPTEPNGPNNLGFVLLASGKAEDAIRLFETARELGFTKREISDANIACALYLLGKKDKALALFQACLRQNPFTGPATLFGVDAHGLFPIAVNSAGEYASLMMLNAAWCAISAVEKGLARHYVDAAKTAELTLRDDPQAERFVSSVRELDMTTK